MIGTGEVLFGRYRLDARLGESEGVEVWQGADLHALAPVHVKVWAEDHDPRPALLEGEAMAAAQHPGVVRLVDFGLHEGRQPCMMMESVVGETLAERLRDRGPLPWVEALALGAEVLDGLAALHDEGLVHGDVSTRSLVLVPHGTPRVKLVGLQHVVLAGEGWRVDQGPAGVLETKAPEQLAGTEVRPGTDLYALGLVLWEAITGASPFAAEPGRAAARLRWRPEPEALPPSAVPSGVAMAVLEAMMRPSLSFREADARACARRLRAAIGRGAGRAAHLSALAAG